MIKMVVQVWKKEGMTDEEFRLRWLNEHGDLVRKHAKAMGFVRYIQSHKIISPEIQSFSESRGWRTPPDGLSELWWKDYESMRHAVNSPEGIEASRILSIDEAEFVDMSNVSAFLSVEKVIFDHSQSIMENK